MELIVQISLFVHHEWKQLTNTMAPAKLEGHLLQITVV